MKFENIVFQIPVNCVNPHLEPKLPNSDHLPITATNFGPRGWSLYTSTIQCTISNNSKNL